MCACSKSKSSHRCRKCGADALATPGHCTRLVQLGSGAEATREEAHYCGGCCKDLATDAQRDEYVRLALLA
jgi:hypothetical protein